MNICLVRKPGNGVDKNMVSVMCLNSYIKEEVVCHVPQNILKVVSLYLFLPHCYLDLEVTGKCVNGGGSYGYELLQVFLFMGMKRPRSGPK